MVIMHDAAIRTDRNINTGLFIIFITCPGHFDRRSRLSTADTLLLTGDADGAAADTDLDEVCTGFCQEAESFRIDDVSGTDLDTVAITIADPLQRDGLPLAEAFAGIDAQYVRT